MRKETSNQFSEGLISDLNPINTPKTALTDNLNGTIITYNGNEFSLQNDRGNYELKNCKLKPNYIPVGIKEHGDILYIVSYNPLDESVEVGSYPSPLQVNEIEAESDELDFGSIIKSEIIDGPKTKGYNNYSKLVTKEKYIVFNGEDYKLYPGDMYKLETGSDSPYRYEKFEYFILDEESNTHNITEEIKNPKTVDENGFSYVGWDIPGWITAKARLAKLSSAGLNIRSFYAPEIDENTRDVYYDFILRLNIDDELLKERIFVDSIYQREVKFVIEISGEKPKIIDSCELSEWYSDNKIIWKSISGNMTAGKNDVITVKMTPILTEKHKDGEYTIVYDNLKQEQEFDLSRVNDKPWTAGESLYKYYVSSDKTGQRIEFIVDGPKVSSSQIDLQYRIKTIDGDYVIGNSNSWNTFPDYYGIGSNYVSIPFTEEFKKENIYILEWRFFGIDGYTRNLPSRLLITTELLTGAEKESVYDRDINTKELINLYISRLKNTFVDPEIIIKNSTFSDDIKKIATEQILNYCDYNRPYNTFVPMDEYFDEFDIKIGNEGQQEVLIKNHEYLTGDLWDNLIFWNLTQNDSLLSKKYQNEITTTLNVFKGIDVHGVTDRHDSDIFYRDSGYYFSDALGLNVFDLKIDLVNEHEDYSSLQYTWQPVLKTTTIPTINDNSHITAFINEYKFPLNFCDFYKVKIHGDGVYNVFNNDGSSTSINGDWLLVFKSNKSEKYNRVDDLACFINTEREVNITTILDHLYFTKDEVRLTEHVVCTSDFNTEFSGIKNIINTNFEFSDKWWYNNKNLIASISELDVLYKLDSYKAPDKITIVSEYTYETDISLDVNIELDAIKNTTSGKACTEQMFMWNKHPLKYNATKKTMGPGVYSNSTNDNLNLLAKKLDESYKEDKSLKVKLDSEFKEAGYTGLFTQYAYWLGGSGTFLNSDEHKTPSRI